jgi:Na+/proline symporter
MMRVVVLVFTAIVTIFAMNTESSIYKMVENAYKVTLVAAFVPLAFGLYWKRATAQGGLVSIIFGIACWIALELTGTGRFLAAATGRAAGKYQRHGAGFADATMGQPSCKGLMKV